MSRLAVKASSVVNPRITVKKLYKDWLLAIPTIQGAYQLDLSKEFIKAKIRSEFDKHRQVTNPSVISVLVHKAKTELEETLMMWKQPSHVWAYFRHEEAQAEKPYMLGQDDFLSRFYAGRDDVTAIA